MSVSMQLCISIREANQHVSRYLEKVEQGDEVVLTRRGTPVAKVVASGLYMVVLEARKQRKVSRADG